MRSVVCAWCNSNSNQFENFVPLKFVGKHNLKLGFSNDIDIVFIEGFSLLDKDYIIALSNLGFKLHDASNLYSELCNRYVQLNQFGDYEKKCFLRWLVLEKYFAREPLIHFDGDIIFNENPKIISKILDGLTFILQGCPAVTAISNAIWFDQYRESLNHFVEDVPGFSAEVWQYRFDWEDAERTWTGLREREVISSDQDLFRHLLHTSAILQSSKEEIKEKLDCYVLFENPLYLDAYYSELKPFKYQRKDGIDFLSNRQVLLWHMQSSFNAYLGSYLQRKKYFWFMPFQQIRREGIEIDLYNFLMKKRFLKRFSRIDVYQHFFQENDFKDVFQNDKWWSLGVFL